MPRRRDFRAVALGLLGAFVGRNNDVGGYWALGKLRRHGLDSGSARISVDLLDRSMTPAKAEFEAMIARLRDMLSAQLSARGLPAEWLASSVIEIEFAEPLRANGDGGEFICVVRIVDDRGRDYQAEHRGRCRPHNQRKESKSTRAKSAT